MDWFERITGFREDGDEATRLCTSGRKTRSIECNIVRVIWLSSN